MLNAQNYLEECELKFYCEDHEKVLDELQSTRDGLNSAEAAKRLEANGKNKLAAAKGKSIIRRFLEQLADPMIIILLVAALISGVLAGKIGGVVGALQCSCEGHLVFSVFRQGGGAEVLVEHLRQAMVGNGGGGAVDLAAGDGGVRHQGRAVGAVFFVTA